MASQQNPVGLEVRDIVKRFSGVPALKGVSVGIQPGKILGLVGHNGAGKSTLLKVISGAYKPDSGVIGISGKEVVFSQPSDAIQAGIATVYQELSLVPNLTVTQNVHLGHELTSKGLLRREEMREDAARAMRKFNLDVDVDRKVQAYPVAVRQLMEIAIAVHRQAQYLLLDEPTTALEGEQISQLLEAIRSLATDKGMGIIFISHKLDELYQISDQVVALVDGEVLIDGPVTSVPRNELIAAIAGSGTSAIIETDSKAGVDVSQGVGAAVESAPTIVASNLRTAYLHGVNLQAHAGRVLGLYGLIGSGRTEFLRALVGLDPIIGGQVLLNGKDYRPSAPAQSVRNGIAYVTEERKASGIVPQLDSRFNVALPILGRFTRAGVLDKKKMLDSAEGFLDQLRVIGNRKVPIESLSGGNQQKVVLARALGQQPDVLLLDEPTKGVDIGVKVEIHRIVRSLARESGLTVILVSSEEEEILAVADDVHIFQAGTCYGERRLAAGLSISDLRAAAWAAA
ncbi:MAG: sugar ABC transporter ATP-binding protein [Propionibacteriaceae bacterium]|nr:sugar ABC transporter ATP-binding protein [Propionibacteriaceae bacterium]